MGKLKKFNEHLENESLKEIIEDYFMDFKDSGILEIQEAENSSFSLLFDFNKNKNVKDSADKLEFFISLGEKFRYIKERIEKLSLYRKISYSMDDYVSFNGVFEIDIYGLKMINSGFEKVSKSTWDEVFKRGRHAIDSKTVLFIRDKLIELGKDFKTTKYVKLEFDGWTDDIYMEDSRRLFTNGGYRKTFKPKFVHYDFDGTVVYYDKNGRQKDIEYWFSDFDLFNFDDCFGIRFVGEGRHLYIVSKDEKSVSDLLKHIIDVEKNKGYLFR
jgi:hypothetical protein